MKKTRRLRTGENLFVWMMLVFSITVLILAYRISGFSSISSPGTFPMAAAAVMAISICLVLIENRKLRKPEVTGFIDEMHRATNRLLPRVIIVYTGIVLAYGLLIKPLHFFPSSFVFLFFSMIYLKGSVWTRSLVITAGALIGVYIIFQFVFKVMLP